MRAQVTAHRAAAVAMVALAACSPLTGEMTSTPDPHALAAATSCAPPGWTAEPYPYGSSDIGLGPRGSVGNMRLFRPETVEAMRGRSKPGGVTFATDWWTVTEHEQRTIDFGNGRIGKQYRSRSGSEITTEFSVRGRPWQLWSSTADHHDDVVRCVEDRLSHSS